MDIIGASLDLLYQDAKSRYGYRDGNVLALCYVRSLVRRMEMRAEARDEVRIALALRRPPVFGFISNEEKRSLTSVLPLPSKPASHHLSGQHQTVHTMRGEVKSFGTQAACHGRSHFQKVRQFPMVET